MAVPLIYVAVAGGRIAYSFLKTPAGRKAAQEFAKNLVKRGKNAKVTNSKPPNVKVTQGPRRVNPEKPNQPVNPKTGKFQKRGPAPVKVTPKKPNQPVKKDTKPSNLPAVPKKKPNAMTASPKKPSRPGDDAKVIGGSKSKPSNRDYSVRNVPRPKRPNASAALLRSSTIEGGPKVDTTPPEDKKKKQQDRKFKPKTTPDPKKTKPSVKAPPRKGPPTKKKPSKKPQQRPAQGPVTNESFAAAFKRNRAAKKPTFTWKGKLYTTRYKEESIAEHKKKFGVEGKYKK